MATKVKIKNIKAIERNVENKIRQFKTSSTEMSRAAKIIQSSLRETLTNGENFDGTPMPSLNEKTIKRRARLATTNKKSKFASPAKSNVTFTGDFIRKIFAKSKGDKIVIAGKGNHKRYKGIRVKTLKGSDSPISEIIKGLQDKGWKILGVTEDAKDRIRKQFLRFLKRK